MPHVILKLAAGRADAQKSAIVEAITRALVATVGVDEDAVSVAIEDVRKDDWVEQVYKPDILPRWIPSPKARLRPAAGFASRC